MVWIETETEHQSAFKKPWMDEKIEWTDTRRANVPEDVAARLVEERDDISYASGPDAEADDGESTETDREGEADADADADADGDD